MREGIVRPIALCVACLCALVAAGCAGERRRDSDSTPFNQTRAFADVLRVTANASPTSPQPPTVTVNGVPLDERAVIAGLSELAGATVIEELALDHLLIEECRRAGVSISAEDVAGERSAMLGALAESGGDAPALLERLRDARGLGPTRFDALLRRNAMLRALVRDRVVVSPEMVEQRYRVRYGVKMSARLIFLPSAGEAERAKAEAGASTESTGKFIEIAIARSLDASSSRGGQLEPIHAEDPGYPAALREAIAGTQVGAISRVFAIDTGWGIVLRGPDVPAQNVKLEDVRAEVEQEVRRRTERLHMDQLSSTLIGAASVRTSDPSLEWAWRARARRAGVP